MKRKVSIGQAVLRGLSRRCPCCGTGRAFRSYLKIVDVCDSCQTPLGLYPCDDGPAYITMLLVGHLIIAPLFIFEGMWRNHIEVMLPAAMFGMGLLTLIILPFVKGGFLGLLWHHGLKQNR
jgi:uncharacterized protein (DUF983 family)